MPTAQEIAQMNPGLFNNQQDWMSQYLGGTQAPTTGLGNLSGGMGPLANPVQLNTVFDPSQVNAFSMNQQPIGGSAQSAQDAYYNAAAQNLANQPQPVALGMTGGQLAGLGMQGLGTYLGYLGDKKQYGLAKRQLADAEEQTKVAKANVGYEDDGTTTKSRVASALGSSMMV